MREVIVIFGPPGAGKTTLAREIAGRGGLRVFDSDDAVWRGEAHFRAALRHVGRDPSARAVVIRAGATRSARGKVVQMVGATEVRLLDLPLGECVSRIQGRGTDVRRGIAAARSWWRRFEPGEPVLPAPPRRVGSPRERGYGAEHRALRRRWAPKVAAGVVCCARCGDPIVPGEPWDLGHDDHDRSRYNGPEHAACNRATAGRRKRRAVSGRSRVW